MCDFHSTPRDIGVGVWRELRQSAHAAGMVRIFEKSTLKRTLEKLGIRWEDNINMILKEVGCEDGRLTELA
jgi:hypothetical protein